MPWNRPQATIAAPFVLKRRRFLWRYNVGEFVFCRKQNLQKEGKKSSVRCINLLKMQLFSWRYSAHIRVPVKAFPQITKSSHLASPSCIADIDVIVVVGWMNSCSTPTLDVMVLLFACRQEIWPLWRKKSVCSGLISEKAEHRISVNKYRNRTQKPKFGF